MNDHTWRILDTGAIGVTAATIFHWLPDATAALSFVYILIRLYETHTSKRALSRLKQWLSD